MKIIERQRTFIQVMDYPTHTKVNDSHLIYYWNGLVTAEFLTQLPGGNGEHTLFVKSPTGGINAEQWARIQHNLALGTGCYPPALILVDSKKGIHIAEGNHHIRAAAETGSSIEIELRVFGDNLKVPWADGVLDILTGEVTR